MKNLILVDGTALLYRGFFAIPPYFSTKDGVQTNAVYGVSLMLLNIFAREKPDYLAIAFDSKEKTFRHEEFKEYKAHRPPPPPGLYEQFPLLEEVLGAFDIPVFKKPGYEADDIIATLTEQALTHPHVNVGIATGDLDMTQLVNERVHVFAPQNGFNKTTVYDIAGVREKFGLRPDQIVDYKALRGDASDNIPGVKGIGEKTAVSLLHEYETLENIYEHLNDIAGAVGRKLADDREMAFFSKKLVTLDCAAPVMLDLSRCEAYAVDWHNVISVFKRFEFGGLVARVHQLFKITDMAQPTLF